EDYTDLRFWRPVRASTVVPVELNVTTSDSMGIAAVIVLNDVSSDVEASIVDTPVTAGTITVEAIEAATIWAATDVTGHSAGGSSLTGQGQSLAAGGVIATNRVLSAARALVGNSPLTSTTGGIEITATNDSLIEATTLAAMTSGAQSVGIQLAFNTVGWGRSNLLFAAIDALLGDPLISEAFGGADHPSEALASVTASPIDSAGDVVVRATSTAQILAELSNAATSAPAAIKGAGGMSVNGILASSMVNSRAAAFIESGTVDADGSVTVAASDEARISSTTAMYSEVSPTNDAGAGILNRWTGQFLGEYRFTQHSGTREVHFGDKVRADDGTIYRYMGTTRSINLLVEDYSDFGYWKELTPINLITDSVAYAVLSTLGVAGEANSYFLLVDHNDLRSTVEAHLLEAPVIAGGDVTVTADELAELIAFDESVTSSWDGKGAVVVTNVLLSSANAFVADGDLTGHDVTVSATNASTMDATATSKIESWDNVSFVLSFNSIGWKPSNLLFNLIDAFLGDPLISDVFDGQQPSEAIASLDDVDVHASGNLAVTATQASKITAVTGNENIAEAVIDIALGSSWQAEGMSGGAIVATNKVNTKARATIDFSGAPGTIEAADVLVMATDSAEISSTATVVQVSIVQNDLTGVTGFVGQFFENDYDYTTKSGEVTLRNGDRVR
ncbi:MAG TPA: hypothetical protein VGK49_04340, partial [Ilumatobacteraceae bacterium]